MSRKFFSLLSERRRMLLWLASSPISVPERLWARRVFRTRPSSWRFELDGFMTPWSFDAFGSGSKQRCWLWWANHGPIRDSRPIAVLGYARGHRVHLEARC